MGQRKDMGENFVKRWVKKNMGENFVINMFEKKTTCVKLCKKDMGEAIKSRK